jgi:hypothetical protein
LTLLKLPYSLLDVLAAEQYEKLARAQLGLNAHYVDTNHFVLVKRPKRIPWTFEGKDFYMVVNENTLSFEDDRGKTISDTALAGVLYKSNG